jgi:hypothetical protein
MARAAARRGPVLGCTQTGQRFVMRLCVLRTDEVVGVPLEVLVDSACRGRAQPRTNAE